jgi:hypothetical protein
LVKGHQLKNRSNTRKKGICIEQEDISASNGDPSNRLQRMLASSLGGFPWIIFSCLDDLRFAGRGCIRLDALAAGSQEDGE